jgi:hypothetical protein
MAARHLLFQHLLVPVVIASFPVCRGWSAQPEQGATPTDTATARLVRAALEQEVAGNNARRDAMLREALYDSPDDALAHWQLAQVRVQGRWQSPAEVEQAARQDKRLTEYRRRRDASARSVADQAALARWCRKNRLDDQQRLHWLLVLQLQPDNAEAIHALALRSYQGMMLTPAQIQQLKAQLQRVGKAAEDWRLLVAQWHRAAESHDPAIPAVVREKVAATADPADMLGLERALWRQVAAKGPPRLYREMLLALMPVLGGSPQPAAAESLVRHAVFPSSDQVRTAAVLGLKRHPLDHSAPLLISGLQSPIEVAAMVAPGGDSVSAWYSLYQEGPLADVSMTSTFSWTASYGAFVQFDDGATAASLPEIAWRLKTGRISRDDAMFARLAGPSLQTELPQAQAASAERATEATAIQAGQFDQAARDLRDAVERANRGIRQRNARITAALSQLTRLNLGSEPMDWWKWWWQDYNEMYNVSGRTTVAETDQPPKPVYEYSQWRSAHESYVIPVPCSCFAPGTKVWTLTGRQPIERIKIGDCVLAQDVESGELAYKPVLAVTIRRPGAWMRMRLGAESITATPSHPFWVCGLGWRMTKQLQAGSRIHSLSGGVPVEKVETLGAGSLGADAAYNLIVPDDNSYFVGDRGILVHDNTPRRPTAAIVPGLIERGAR